MSANLYESKYLYYQCLITAFLPVRPDGSFPYPDPDNISGETNESALLSNGDPDLDNDAVFVGGASAEKTTPDNDYYEYYYVYYDEEGNVVSKNNNAKVGNKNNAAGDNLKSQGGITKTIFELTKQSSCHRRKLSLRCSCTL